MIPSISQPKKITKEHFGFLNKTEVFLYTLTNSEGDQVKITNYGATLTSWVSKDKTGRRSDILVGFKTLQEYLDKSNYHFGGIIGRFANRIAEGKFTVHNNEYKVTQNEGANHIHGGSTGFDQVIWNAEIIEEKVPTLSLKYLSPDGEEGYPGNMHVEVKYSFTNENELILEYKASTDKTTPINLTSHSYFNLSGKMDRSVLDHKLKIDADSYIPIDKTHIPTGIIQLVHGTAYDFIHLKKIGDSMDQAESGYDHCYILNKKGQDNPAALLKDDEVSGRTLEVYTTEPGIQFYSGNSLSGQIQTSNGTPLAKQSALCLETQHFPNSPNQKEFPSTILKPEEFFHSITRYKCSLQL